ncbi:hypothetical protein E4F39_24655 [Burkholderia pseudomallei]|nr:hypothetical protein [Burkholderia pseudomallei]MPT92443.1 hypothetical protein [Burkholderia pseudomallei]QEW49942.1 hypothetical protein E4F39_24655 [Burkholderia pseudomallei]QEW64370.1 hypothetical protein E4F37_29890 [Burkholderia pseudomallei]QEW72050.1 hypothetical protein E4F36_34900 [Burkholderia pseudomallei]
MDARSEDGLLHRSGLKPASSAARASGTLGRMAAGRPARRFVGSPVRRFAVRDLSGSRFRRAPRYPFAASAHCRVAA